MALSLAQLTAPLTPDAARAQVLAGLQGRGVVIATMAGTGFLTLSGTPTVNYSVQVKIAVGGEPGGAATYQVSSDGGTTWSSAAPMLTTPDPLITAGSPSGALLTFAPGPAGAGTSFVAGDLFAFRISSPTFPVTSWQPGSVPLALADVDAQEIANLTSLVALIARGGYVTAQPGVTGASASWLDLLATNVYALTRQPAVATRGTVTLTDTANAGPFTITAGQLWIADTPSLATATVYRYNNTTGGTLPLGGTLVVTVAAESPGAAYNRASGNLTTLLTGLPGVTVTNGANWITTQGADVETDLALATRCQGQWSGLGKAATSATYDSWARTASAEVTRTKVQADAAISVPTNAAFTAGAGTLVTGTYYYRVTATKGAGETLPSTETSLAITGPAGVNVNWGAVAGADGYKVYGRTTGAEQLVATISSGTTTTWLDGGSVTPSGALPTVSTNPVGGQVDIWLAGTSGAVSGTAVSAVQAYILPRLPLGSTQAVASAIAFAATIAGTVNVFTAQATAAQAAVATNLAALINATPVGGTLYLSAVIRTINDAAGVRNSASITINGSAADLVLTAAQVATLTNSLTFVSV